MISVPVFCITVIRNARNDMERRQWKNTCCQDLRKMIVMNVNKDAVLENIMTMPKK